MVAYLWWYNAYDNYDVEQWPKIFSNSRQIYIENGRRLKMLKYDILLF